MSDLPKGWVASRIDGLAGFVRGVSFKKHEGGDVERPGHVPVLRAGNLQDGKIVWDDLVFVPAPLVSESQRLRVGDIVVAMSSGSASVVGKAAPVRVADAGRPAGFGAFCGLWRAKDPTLAPWLQQFFQTAEYRQTVSAAALGVNINNLRADHIGGLEVPFPPLNEQRRIVAKLEALQDRSRRAREALDAVPPLLEKLRQSILAAAFRGDLTKDWRAKNPDVEPADKLLARIRTERRQKWEAAELAKLKAKGKPPTDDRWKSKYEEPLPLDATGLPGLPRGWAWASCEELSEASRPIIYGIIKAGPHFPGGVPYVRVTEVAAGRIVVDELPRCDPERAAKFTRSVLAEGDILVSKDGTIGRVAFVPRELAGGNINQHVLRVAPVPAVDRFYLARMIECPHSQRWMKGEVKGIALQGVNVEDFRRLPLPLAPQDEQRVIVSAIASALEREQAVTRDVEVARSLLASADRAVLAKAFRGELVPQDPADEPAEVMLARLRGDGAPSSDSPAVSTKRARVSKRKAG